MCRKEKMRERRGSKSNLLVVPSTFFTGEVFRMWIWACELFSMIPGPGTQGSSQYLCKAAKKLVPKWSLLDQYQCREQEPQNCVGSQPWTSQRPVPSTTWKQPPLLLQGKGVPSPHCLPLSIIPSQSASYLGLWSASLTMSFLFLILWFHPSLSLCLLPS